MKLLPTLNLRAKLQSSAGSALDIASSIAQVMVPGGGSVICFAVGKVVVGLILACITAAVVMRLVWRRKRADHAKSQERLPVWAQIAAVLLALIGSGTLVEMAKLPVRFDQPGFALSNWLIVMIAIYLLNGWCRSLFKTWLHRKSPSSSLVEKQ
jgi:amino acid transporter